MFNLLRRLDLWGAVVDLLGLTALLSYDVPFLIAVLHLVKRLPRLQRLSALSSRVHRSYVEFAQVMHGPMMPERLETLRGTDAALFLHAFPNRDHSEAPPALNVCAVYFDAGLRGEPWIYAAVAAEEVSAAQKPLAGPIPLSMLFTQFEKQVQNTVYATGFILMAVGSILSIMFIVRSHT